MPVPIVPPAPGWFSITTGCPQYSESFWPNVRARMSVALPAVNGTMILTGFVGHACAPANEAHSAQSAITARRTIFIVFSSTQSIADRHILGDELDAGCLGFEQQQLRKVLFGHAVSDQGLHDVARDRRERHRHVEASCRIKAQIEILAQQVWREGHLEIEIDECRRLVARKRRAHHALVDEIEKRLARHAGFL